MRVSLKCLLKLIKLGKDLLDLAIDISEDPLKLLVILNPIFWSIGSQLGHAKAPTHGSFACLWPLILWI